MEPDFHGVIAPSCVVAQQHSPATFVSMRSHFGKGTFGAGFNNAMISFPLTFLNRVSLKLRNWKLCN